MRASVRIHHRIERIHIQNSGQSFLKRTTTTWLFGMTLIAMLVALSGCSKRYDNMPAFLPVNFGDPVNYSVGRFKTAYVADQIDYFYRGTSNGPIGVTTLVNLDDLYSTSSFGRMYAEQLMSELAMRGFDVIELRHADALQFLNNSGEFALSRDISAIRNARDLAGVVVGTYVESPDRVYVNVRLIDPATSLIVSAGSVEFGRTREVSKLLRGNSLPVALERIPVKNLGYSQAPLAMFPKHIRNYYDLEESFAVPFQAPPGSFNYGPPPPPPARPRPPESTHEGSSDHHATEVVPSLDGE